MLMRTVNAIYDLYNIYQTTYRSADFYTDRSTKSAYTTPDLTNTNDCILYNIMGQLDTALGTLFW